MTKATRILRLAALLRSEGDAAAVRDLARRLGVSERTVFRDLALLRHEGLPLEGRTGRGGGVRALGTRGVTSVHLGLDDVVSLWLAAQLARAGGELPWGDHADVALRKLVLSLPASRATALRALCRRIWVGPPPTASMRLAFTQPPREVVRALELAATQGHAISFEYAPLRGPVRRRLVEPHGLLVQPPLWYVLARDVDLGEPRMFRVDRMRAPVRPTRYRFTPDGGLAESLLSPGLAWTPLLRA